MAITRKEVDDVARLARLALTEEERQRYTEQLGSILTYFEALNKLKTDNVPPMTHALPLTNVWREDRSEQGVLASQEELLANAPEREGPFFKVKKVIE